MTNRHILSIDVYPIRIDPTVEINYDASGASAIEDITISTGTTYSGTSGSLYVGRRSSTEVARILMRFPGLDLSGLAGATVTSANVMLRDLMCESASMDVYCYVFGGSVWNASSATWSNCNPDGYTDLLTSKTLSYSTGNALNPKHYYAFDITNAVQGWVAGNCDPDKGILFKASASVENGTATTNRTFGSYNRSSNKPSLSVTYTSSDYQYIANDTYYLNNRTTGKYLQKNSLTTVKGESGLISSLLDTIRWDIQKVTGGYTLRSHSDATKYLGVTSSASGSGVTIVTVSNSTIPSNCLWSITSATGGGCQIRSLYNSSYLTMSGSTVSTLGSIGGAYSSTYIACTWRFVSTSDYGTHSAYTYRELSSFSVNNLTVGFWSTETPIISASPNNTLWAELADFEFSFNSGANDCASVIQSSNKIKGLKSGTATYQATHRVTGRTTTFTVMTEPLLVYQTEATYYHDKYGNNAEDLECGDLSLNELMSKPCFVSSDFDALHTPSYRRTVWENMVRLFATDDLQAVALDMIDRFMAGTGDSYSNSTLTTAVRNHQETQTYITEVQQCIIDLMQQYSGDITALSYVVEGRDDLPLVSLMQDRKIFSPVYNSGSDTIDGLKICIDSLWGVKIEVSEFTVNGSTFSCTLHYTLYDHFGLDESDIEKFGFAEGFRSWYILQHYINYNKAYKPFLTLMEFDTTFTGALY